MKKSIYYSLAVIALSPTAYGGDSSYQEGVTAPHWRVSLTEEEFEMIVARYHLMGCMGWRQLDE